MTNQYQLFNQMKSNDIRYPNKLIILVKIHFNGLKFSFNKLIKEWLPSCRFPIHMNK